MIDKEKTVREIAVESPVTVRVFEEFSIDYCCGGAKSLREACESVGAVFEQVEQKLSESMSQGLEDGIVEPTEMSATSLIGHILEKHHTYAKKEIERLIPLMAKVSGKHGEKQPELLTLEHQLTNFKSDLLPHMHKEEMVLFPFIIRLESAVDRNTAAPVAPAGAVKHPIRMMMFEHETAGTILKEMRVTANQYVAPEDACPSFKALYFGLEELEKDIHRHIHLENNVLFPKALELELKSLSKMVREVRVP